MQEWVLDERKFLTDEEIEHLKRNCRTAKEKLIINLGLLAGLRVKEVADLKCGDISLLAVNPSGCYSQLSRRMSGFTSGITTSSLTVRNGKGGKPRLVRFNGELKESIMEYLNNPLTSPLPLGERERVRGENEPLLKSGNNGHISRRTIQRVFERVAGRAGISGHSFHHLRHTYASYLYRASNYNLRLVQKQLGHSSIKTTQVYADVFDEDLNQAVEKLYK